MGKQQKWFVISLIEFIIILALVATLINGQTKTRTTENKDTPQQVSHNLLKADFFDDITGGWGDSKSDGGIEWKAGDSQYAARTAPIPVIHPLTLNPMQEKLVAIPKSDVLTKIDPSGEKNMTVLIEGTAKKYGEVRATHFVSTGQYILTQRYFDVDKDGVKEEVLETMGIGGNHPPHEGFILKNDTIILTMPLNSGGVDPTTDGNGFYVKHQVYDDQPMCCPLKYRLYRVIYEGGKFVPVWEQDVSYLQFSE